LLSSRDTRALPRVDLGLQHPPSQRLRTDADFRADRLAGGIHRPVLINVIEHHLHRTLTLLHRVMLRHGLHPSHRRKRHQTRNGSLAPAASADIDPLVPYGTNPQVPSLGFHESNHDEANTTNGFVDVPF
jgi:hypothetical protein